MLPFNTSLIWFGRFRDKLGVKVVKALKRNNDGVTHAAIDALCALMQVKLELIIQSTPS